MKVVLFGSLFIVFLTGILFPQRQKEPVLDEKFFKVEEWLNSKKELENCREEISGLDKEINNLVDELNKKKREFSELTSELDKIIKRREISELSTELHRMIKHSDDLVRRQAMLLNELLKSIPEILNELEQEKQIAEKTLDETQKEKLNQIEEYLETLKKFETEHKDEALKYGEELELPYLPDSPEFVDEDLPDDSILKEYYSEELFQEKIEDLTPQQKLFFWRLVIRLKKLERENRFLLNRAQKNAEELKEIKDLIKLGKDFESMQPRKRPGMRGRMMPGMRGERRGPPFLNERSE